MHPYAIDRLVAERIEEMHRLSRLDPRRPRRRRFQLPSRWTRPGPKAGRQTATYSAPSSPGVA